MKVKRNVRNLPNRKKRLFVPKMVCILLVLFLNQLFGLKVFAQNAKIYLSENPISVIQLFNEIERQAGYMIIYSNEEVDTQRKFFVKNKNDIIASLLQQAFDNTDITFSVENKYIVIKKRGNDTAVPKPQIRISGVVKDSSGELLPGASVRIKGFNKGAATDSEGTFICFIPEDKAPKNIILQVSFVGMQPQEIVYKGTPITIKLQPDDNLLKDVVITGYQRIDRRQSTSSVSSVKAEDILIPGMNTIDVALEGRIPDLMVMQNSGSVGATSRLRVRGTSTILGNREPLWVVDGFIITDPVDVDPQQLNDPDFINLIGNAIAGVNPQDIDRIDVLKDASATALYGTRAANGVIVITTKMGKEGPVRISYDHTSKFMTRPTYDDAHTHLMNSYERVRFGKNLIDIHYNFPSQMAIVGYEGAYMQFQQGQISFEEFEQRVRVAETANVDWLKLLTRNTYSGQHNLQLSGGTKSLRYFASLGYDKNNGVAINENTERYSMRANLSSTISSKIRFSLNLSGNVQKKNHTPPEINLLSYAFNTSRAIPTTNPDGSCYHFPNRAYNLGKGIKLFPYSIFTELENSHRKYNGNGFTTNAMLVFTPIPKLDIMFGGSFGRNNTQQETWWGEKSHYVALLRNEAYGEVPPSGELGYSLLPYGGILNTNNTLNESFTGRTQIDYRFTVADKNYFSILFGLEAYSNRYKGANDEFRGFLRDRGLQFIQDVDLEKYPLYKNWINKNHHKMSENVSNQLSSYLSMNYSYENHFILNGNARIDYSNKFGNRAMEKFLPVWSVSGRWNIHENLLKDKIPHLSEFIIKGSYGKQGNMLDSESPNMIIRQGSIDPFYNENISTIARFPNPKLLWEQTRQINLGSSISFLQQRIQLGVEYYHKKTTDVFMPVNVLSTNGVTTYVMNGGDVYNMGWNVSLSGSPIRTMDKAWTISAQISKALNNVRSSPAERYQIADYLNGRAVINGYPISTFFSYKYSGLNPVDGVPLFDDYADRRHLLMNKSLEEVVLTALENSGTREPLFAGGLSNTFRYKQLSLSCYLTYSVGSKIRLFPLFAPILTGVKAESNLRTEFLDRWIGPGDEKRTDIPSIISPGSPNYNSYIAHYSNIVGGKIPVFGNNVWTMYDQSNFRVVSGDCLRLSSLSVRYRVKREVLKKTRLQEASISLSGMNLYTISSRKLKGQDPMQAGFAVPQMSVRPSYSLQFNVTF